jgi:hypothetical protein
MGAPFRDARLKIKRADKHVADLKHGIVSLENTKTRTIQHNDQTGAQELIYEIPNLDNALSDLSLIAGDAFHNLRSALDYAWRSALERYVPSAVQSRNRFPVFRTIEKLEEALKGIKVDSICPSLFEAIVSNIQPYETGNAGVIWSLNTIDNRDKHVVLLGLRPFTGINGIVVRDANGDIFRGTGVPVQRSGPLVIPFPGDFQIENHGELVFEITVEEAGIFQGSTISDLLSHFSQYVLYVVELLENL